MKLGPSLCAVLLAGCASSGPISTGPDSYMLTSKSWALGGTAGDAKSNGFREAGEFCTKQGKSFVPQSGSERPGWPGKPPEAEVHFLCVAKSDPAYQRSNITPTPSTVIEVKK